MKWINSFEASKQNGIGTHDFEVILNYVDENDIALGSVTKIAGRQVEYQVGEKSIKAASVEEAKSMVEKYCNAN
jgi:hypothetical protein